MKREGILGVSKMKEKVVELVEKLKSASSGANTPLDIRFDISSPEVPEELALSDSEPSKSIMNEGLSDIRLMEEDKEMDIEQRVEELDNGRSDLFDSESEDMVIMSKILNTESEEYDFSANTGEGKKAIDSMSMGIEKYSTPNPLKSPFAVAKRSPI